MLRKIYIAGIVAYACMLVLSLFFFKERVLFIDSAFYMFDIVNTGQFTIQHSRFISVFTQLLPLLAQKLSLSLRAIMLAYSANMMLFHFACYLLCGLLKDHRMGVALLLFNFLFATYSFFWPMSEFLYGGALVFPFLALLRSYSSQHKLHFLIIAILFIPILAFAHPLIIFAYMFGLVFFLIDSGKTIHFKIILLAAFLYIATLVIKTLFFKASYDAGAMSSAGNLISLFPNYIDLYANKAFIKNCLTIYYWIPVSTAAIVAVYISARRWKKLALYLAAMAGYLLLINVCYHSAEVPNFYIENLYTPLAVFIALPLVFDVFPALDRRHRLLSLVVVCIIVATGLLRTYMVSDPYTARVEWQRNFLATHKDVKIVLAQKYVPMDTLFMTWSSPYEFWMLSTIETGKTASVIINPNPDSFQWAMWDRSTFITTWGGLDYKWLDKRYFRFTDTTTRYTFIR